MKSINLGLIVLALSFCANSEEINVINWQKENTTANKLVADGYEIKSVNFWVNAEALYLQKQKNVYRCVTAFRTGKDKDSIDISKCEKLAAQ